MHPLDLRSVLAGTGGRLRGDLPPDARFRTIERDARAVQPGDLFIAIKGERFDGHLFISAAAANGAAAALVNRRWADVTESPLPLIVVEDDPILALQRLAGWWRNRLPTTVVGITGSVGKTSAKEVTAAILGRRFRVYKSPGNLNNEIGLPLSLLEIAPDVEVAVLEMGGAYAFGDLTLLAGIAQPGLGAVLNIHPVHLERMGSLAAIAETKAELVDALPADGVAVLNVDDPLVRPMRDRCRGRIVTFGLEAGADVRATDAEDLGLGGIRFTLEIGDRRWPAATPMVGEHVPAMVLAGLAVGYALGMEPEEMLPALADRAAQIRLRFVPGPGGSQLIDDTYNASPPSMFSSLGVLAAAGAARAIAVLGDMREMGAASADAHQRVGRRAAETADWIITFGAEARGIAAAAMEPTVDGKRPRVTSFGADDRDELIALLRRELGPGDVALLKGSRGLRMEDIVAALGEAAAGEGETAAR
ncbi:MAG: UDP-N-acetylmuramoyl-tripeptide--D-alanyl-D-alanine ligase [Thermomicrobiales bacterium]|nr:UDP-N-acetylmuramoyl-tripeptide--D-alanyl-D-alanine ligase [Thermomicrobiales bacterium]